MSAVYSPHVEFLRKWGIRGSGDGEFRWPQGLAKKYSSSPADAIKELFTLFDADGSGLLEAGEIADMMKATFPSWGAAKTAKVPESLATDHAKPF